MTRAIGARCVSRNAAHSGCAGPGPEPRRRADGCGSVVIAAAAALGLLLTRPRRAVLFFGLAVGGAQLLNLAAKWLLDRPRPALWASLAPEMSLSFPSGHSMAAAALATTLAFLLWPTR